jgi:hypothetical protein
MFKHVVRPGLLLHRYRRRCCCRSSCSLWSFRRYRIVLGRDIPILGRICNSPNIAGIVQCHSDQKSIVPQRQAIRHTARNTASVRQFAEHDRRFQLDRSRTSETASLRAHHQQHAMLGKRTHPVEAGHADRNLHSQPCAASYRLRTVHIHHESAASIPDRRLRKGKSIVSDSTEIKW